MDPTIMKLTTVVDALNLAQLKELSRMTHSRIHAIEGTPIGLRKETPAFRWGDLVEFAARGRIVRIKVERINPKTLGGTEQAGQPGAVPGMKWRASPMLCRLVGSDKPAPLVPASPPGMPSAAIPTAAGAGGW